MAFTLVATAGAVNANAYDTAVNADAYFLAHPLFAKWDRLFTAEKERYLILATGQIEAMPLAGQRATTGTTLGQPNQALHFPRPEDYDTAYYVPKVVKIAMFEQAISLSDKGGTTSKRRTLQQDGVTEITIGDVTEKYDNTQSGGSHELCPRAYQILSQAGLLVESMGWCA